MAKAEKRFSRGLTFITSYTWAHNIDQNNESLDQNLSGVANPYDYRNERGNSGLDRRHNFVGSFTYELPFGRGRAFGAGWNGALDAVLGGRYWIEERMMVGYEARRGDQRLCAGDALNDWTHAVGSAVFAIPGGFGKGDWIARGLFE